MSQARVTDFFATRKRNIFSQDAVLLAKQKRTNSLVEKASNQLNESPCMKTVEVAEVKMMIRSTRSTRSKAKEPELEAQEQAPLKENTPVENKDPVPEEAPKKTRRPKKKDLEELKEKINNFDEKLKMVKRTTRSQKSKVTDEPAESKETPPPEPPVEGPKIEAPKAQEVLPEPKKKEVSADKKQLKADLRQKIAEFNQNLLIVQQKQQAVVKPVEEPAPAPAPVAEKDLPAYVKFKDLASADIDSTCTLTLPKTYSMLLNAFKACDSIVKYHHNTQAVCTFLRLKLGVQNLIKAKFEKLHLAQIKTVYAQAYLYTIEKLFIDFKNDYHLTISLNFDEVQANAEGKKDFNSLILLKRFEYFKNKLFSIVKQLHQDFLKSMNINIEAKDIKRWHPAFNLDEIKPIEPSELPEPRLEQISTSKDLKSIADTVYNKRIKDAINGLVSETNAKLAEKKLEAEKAAKKTEIVVEFEEPPTPTKLASSEPPAPVAAPAPTVKPIETVPATPTNTDDYLAKLKEKKDQTYNEILERVKAKEKAKAIETMIINSDQEKQLAKYQNIAEATRLLSFFFDSEKKSIVEIAKACQVLADNLNSRLNSLECRELIEEMTKDPLFVKTDEAQKTVSWLSIVKVRLQVYLKMEKSFDVITLREQVSAKLEELKKSK